LALLLFSFRNSTNAGIRSKIGKNLTDVPIAKKIAEKLYFFLEKWNKLIYKKRIASKSQFMNIDSAIGGAKIKYLKFFGFNL
jgi:hypothetical protein